MKKSLALILATILLLSLFTACGTTEDPAETGGADEPSGETSGETKDSAIIGLSGEISTFDPWDNAVLITRYLRSNYYEYLLYANEQGEFEPMIAESYDISEDGKTYTFHLYEGILFHNGDELTAEDVVFSLEKACESAGFANETASIVDIKAVDEYTVEVTLSEVNAYFLLGVATRVCIVNKEYSESSEDSYDTPVGTGPYKFVSFTSGYNLVLEAFDQWHGGEVPIKNVEFRVLSDASAAVMSLEAGDIDMTYTVPSISVAELQENPDFTVSMVPTQGSAYLVYNTTVAPFDDINFRKALQYAVDRDQIITSALDGIGTRSVSVWGSNTIGYTGNYLFPEYDMEKAKEYIAASDYDGSTINFIIGNDTYRRTAVILQSAFSELGINVNIEQVESNAWITDMKNGNYQMSLVIHTVEPDCDNWSTRFATAGIGVSNMSHLSDPVVDAAFDAGRATNNVEERCEQYDIVAQYLVDNAIVVPIYYRTMTPAYSSDLEVSVFENTGYAKAVNMSWK